MMRHRRSRGHLFQGQEQQRGDSSRLSPLVMDNPVNQSAHWSHESYFLQDLVTKYPLPQVVRCASRLVPGEDKNLPVNVYVPMLLCTGRTAVKLLAKHVARDQRSQNLTETDDSIVIPSDYNGNFLRLQARTTKDKSMVRTLQYITNNPIPAFINLTPVMSYVSPDFISIKASSGNLNGDIPENNGSHVSSKVSGSSSKRAAQIVHQARQIHPPGSVFVVSGITKGLVKIKRKKSAATLLRCSNEDGTEVLIPTDQAGEFLEVEVPVNGSTKLSVLPQELILTKRYPRLVRFVYGDHAPRLTPCSNLFTLVDTFEEDSVIGCLLYPNHALMIEVPLNSTLNFQVAMNYDHIMSMPLPRHAMDVVRNRREIFVRDLKLKCKFLHQVNSGFGQPVGLAAEGIDDDMPSATMRTRQFANEAFFYL